MSHPANERANLFGRINDQQQRGLDAGGAPSRIKPAGGSDPQLHVSTTFEQGANDNWHRQGTEDVTSERIVQ